jgi:hypothetical protein
MVSSTMLRGPMSAGWTQRTILPPSPLPAALLALEQGFAPVHAVAPHGRLSPVETALVGDSRSAHRLHRPATGKRIVIQGDRKCDCSRTNSFSRRRDGHRAQSCCRLLRPCLDVNGLRRDSLVGHLIYDSHGGWRCARHSDCKGQRDQRGQRRSQETEKLALQISDTRR